MTAPRTEAEVSARAADEAMAQVEARWRSLMRSEAAVEQARATLESAREVRYQERMALRADLRAARAVGATYRQLAAIMGVSIQRAQRLVTSTEVKRR